MVSLQDFSNFPRPGEISLYEKDGQLCSLPASEVDLTNFSAINVRIDTTLLSIYKSIFANCILCFSSQAILT